MLTAKQIEKIANSEWEIVLKRGHHPLRHKGWFLPDKQEVRIYLPENRSEDDLAITLIHELIHIRDDNRKSAREYEIGCDKVEKEALETYRKFPETVNFIKELYSLDY